MTRHQFARRTIRPRDHLVAAGRRYPGAWSAIDEMRAGRGRDYPDWPDWCYVPIAGPMAIIATSLGIVALLMLLRYFSLRATHQIAEDAQARIRAHVRRLARPRAEAVQAAEAAGMTEAEIRAKERADMVELSGQLRGALAGMPEDSPLRPKFEATVEWIERVMRREN